MRTLFSRINFRSIGTIIVIVIVIALATSFLGQFAYFFETVQEQEIGVRFRGGQIYEVVGPGVYGDVGLFVNLQRVTTQAIPFSVEDDEIITKDKQRIGLVVSGDIFRPTDRDTIRNLWAQYRGIFLEDSLALQRVHDLARQAMKVCVGDRTFDQNIIGTARDDLRACIDTELDSLAGEFGLTVRNLVVPEVILSPAVQVALDAIVQSRLETERQLIESRNENELLAAERDVEINGVLARAAAERALADTALQSALAVLYGANPEFLQLQIIQANASALKATDKIIFTPEGTTPTIVLPGPGILPTVDTTPVQPESAETTP